MHPEGMTSTLIIVGSVLLFFFVGIAIMVIMDHKARLPGGFTRDPFSIRGIRRDHPVIAFLTATILLGIIATLVIELGLAGATKFGLLQEAEPPVLVTKLKEQQATERVRRFHRTPERLPLPEGRRNACFFCHGDFPHSKEPMIRTLLNMHTQFVGCMTCHLDPNQVPESALKLRWLNYSGIKVKGPPFGTDVDPATGALVQTDDYYSKVVAYRKEADGERLMELTQEDPEVQEFAAARDHLSDNDREVMKRRFHKSVASKGRACDRCHADADKSLIPFTTLGFSQHRTRDLTSLNLVGLVGKYKKFYLPAMRGEAAAPAEPADTKADEALSTMSKDPAKWWEQTYGRPKGK